MLKALAITLFILICPALLLFAGASAPICSQVFSESRPAFQFNDQESLGYQALQRDLLTLDGFFISQSKRTTSELVNLIISEDLRAVIFRIESILHIYKRKDAEFFEPFLKTFKELEDQIGQIALHESLRDKAKELKQPELAQYFQEQVLKDRANFEKSLEDFNIHDLEQTQFRKTAKEIQAYDQWKNPKKDRQFLLDEMISYAQKVRKDIKELKFDHADIEKGLHELRRKIRWIGIQVKSFDALITFETKTPLSSKTELWFQEISTATPKMLQSKFIRSSTESEAPQSKHSLIIPLKTFGMISQIVTNIGVRKDNSETQIYFEEAIKKTGSKMSISVLKIEEIDHQKMSREFQDRINETDLLGEYIKLLEKLN